MDEFAATSKNFGTGEEEATIPSFVNYVEGIYVGYRFYETAAVEGLIDYDKTVQFPLDMDFLIQILNRRWEMLP